MDETWIDGGVAGEEYNLGRELLSALQGVKNWRAGKLALEVVHVMPMPPEVAPELVERIVHEGGWNCLKLISACVCGA
jgi:hypothetical protein